MQFNYFYGAEAEQFNFIRIPKVMMKDASFASLSLASKMLYGLLLDRMNLSMKNRWFDEENRVYIIYQITEIMDDLGISKKKAIEYLQELEKLGLVEKKRRGFGLPSILYVKNFIIEQDSSAPEKSEDIDDIKEHLVTDNADTLGGVEMGTSRSYGEDTSRGAYSDTSKGVKMEPQEVSHWVPQNNTNKSNNIINNTNHISNQKGKEIKDVMDEVLVYQEYLDDKLEIKTLSERYPEDKEILVGMQELILEILICKKESIFVASNEFPTQLVRSRFMKLDSSHLEYVLMCLKQNTTKVKNIKKYLLATLFNAPITMQGYYQAEFNHDMPHYI